MFEHQPGSKIMNAYRLMSAYLLWRVNLVKIMHKHQNQSASALFCLNSRPQSKYTVIDLIHTRHKSTF